MSDCKKCGQPIVDGFASAGECHRCLAAGGTGDAPVAPGDPPGDPSGHQPSTLNPQPTSLTPEDLKQIEALIKKHKSSGGNSGCLLLLFLLFLLGFFKSCGYLDH